MSTFRMHVAFAVFSGLRGFLYEPKGTTRIHYKISNVLKLGNPTCYNHTLPWLMRNAWNIFDQHINPITTHPNTLTDLEKHANDGHHGQSAICKLCWKLLGLLLRVGGSQDLEAIVARGASLVVIEATAELNKAKVGSDLSPSSNWHLGNCCKSVGDVSELQACGWRQEAWP